MTMVGIVIVAHAPLGQALMDCTAHVVGKIDNVAVHDIEPDDDPDDLAPAVLRDILGADRGAGVLVLTDLIGATPANVAKRAVDDARAMGLRCCVLAGLNTPMLLRALTYRDQTLELTREKALSGGLQGVLRVD